MKKNNLKQITNPVRIGLVSFSLLFCCLFFFAGSRTQAHEASLEPYVSQAREELEKFLTDMVGLIKETKGAMSLEEREKLLYDRAMNHFDFKTFSQLALGRKYRSFSEPQQDEFVYYFSRLISKTYVSRLQGQDVEKISIQYDETTPLQPKKGILRVDAYTQLIQSEVSIPIVYRMIKRDQADWKIYDVQIEGVSMAANYRDQFREAISDSPEQIINDLKEKVKE